MGERRIGLRGAPGFAAEGDPPLNTYKYVRTYVKRFRDNSIERARVIAPARNSPVGGKSQDTGTQGHP